MHQIDQKSLHQNIEKLHFPHGNQEGLRRFGWVAGFRSIFLTELIKLTDGT